jgi:uncharacterized membrane protein
MENSNTPTQSTPQTYDGKTLAIISYLTIIGWIIAWVMHGKNKTALGAFHLRQTLGLMLICIAFYIVQAILIFVPYLGWLISLLFIPLGLGLFVLWILGLVYAINGEEKPIPVIGAKAQQLFHGLG